MFMQKIIFPIIFILICSSLSFLFLNKVYAEEKFYYVKLLYNQSKLALENVSVLPGSISQTQQGGNYRFDLLSLNGKSLYSNKFIIPFYLLRQQTEGEIVLTAPYFSDGKEISVYDVKNIKILEIPVIQFAAITPTPISPTPEFKVTKLEKGIDLPWIVGGVILFLAIGVISIFIYSRLKKPQNLLE